MERRLSAILAVDVVGYSRLMERDEVDTFERLRAHRKDLFEPEIAGHHGRIFKLTGDGLLAEFGSVVDAVECAVTLQRGMTERNNGVADGQRIDVRMGVHVGDVIIEGEDRHGDAVNIAARLQQIAESGGICVSGTVVDHVRHKVALRFEPRGEERLKNIAEPVTAYRVALGLAPQEKSHGRRRVGLWAAAGASILLVAAGVATALYGIPAIDAPPPAVSDQGIPVIIVLPFSDLTGSQAGASTIDLAKVGAGIAEEFITDLSTFPDFLVVSNTTSIALAGKPIPEIVKTTGATFVIEGSIRSFSENATVTMQLIDGKTDRHLQIAQFEEILADPVAMQEAVVAKLRDELGGMTGVLRKEAEKIAWSHSGNEITEYDYYVRGHSFAMREPADWALAEEQWEEGLTRYPDSVLLRCKLIFNEFNTRSTIDDAKKLFGEATNLKKKSRLDEWYYLWVSAWMDSKSGSHRSAVNEAKAAIAMAPFDTVSHNSLAWVLYRAQLYGEALEWFKFAATDPNAMRWYFDDLVQGYSAAQAWPEAVEFANAQIEKNPPAIRYWYDFLGTAYMRSGQSDKATEAWKKLAELPDPPQ